MNIGFLIIDKINNTESPTKYILLMTKKTNIDPHLIESITMQEEVLNFILKEGVSYNASSGDNSPVDGR
jgi:hypothetical protein